MMHVVHLDPRRDAPPPDAVLGRRGLPPSAQVSAGLRYSPGYCGWDLTGQRRLFALLRPHRIGITLSDQDLMWPLKSVSGVLVAGPPRAHRFRPSFAFCAACETRECARRFAATS